MSLIIERFLICDNCGENFGVDDRSNWQNVKHLRKQSYDNGWYAIGNCDWCEKCWMTRKKIKRFSKSET